MFQKWPFKLPFGTNFTNWRKNTAMKKMLTLLVLFVCTIGFVKSQPSDLSSGAAKTELLNAKENFFNISWNQFSETLNVQYRTMTSQRISFHLYDITGKIVRSVVLPSEVDELNFLQMNRDFLNTGIYIAEFTYDGKRITKRIIIG